MLPRKVLFPNVIELNFQAGHIIGCNVYLIYDQDEWTLLDIGYQDSVEEVIDLIRELDFPLSKCKTLIATHADVDHCQGFALAKQILKTTVTAHPSAAGLLEAGDRLKTFAEIEAQGIHLEMPPVNVENHVNDGDQIKIGNLNLEVWCTPGHTDSQLAFRLGDHLSRWRRRGDRCSPWK
jgi:glyoxylase-like metal-dependent hydrolase (beta-lactamase superfamily II)